MATASTTDQQTEWISIGQAARLLDLHWMAVKRLIERRQIRARVIQGCHPRIDKASVLDLLERSTVEPETETANA